MTKTEACFALRISASTLQRKMRSGEVKFTKIGDKVQILLETEPLAAPQSDVLPKVDAPKILVLPVSESPAEITAERSTFTDSMGNKIGDPNPISLLGSGFATDIESAFIRNRDARTTITHEPIARNSGAGAAGVPSGFKENLGYGTSPEGLQQEIDFYRRHPKASMRRYGQR